MTHSTSGEEELDRSTLLGRVSIFSSLPNDTLLSIAGETKRRSYPKNTLLFVEGDESDNLFIIESGVVKIFASDEEGNNVTLKLQSTGDYFGELALIDRQTRSASAITQTEASLITLARSSFESLMEGNPCICHNILEALVRQVRALTESVKDHALSDVYGRVVKVLQNQDKYQSRKRLTHADISDIVGASREMVSKIIKELSLGEYIEQSPNCFVIKKKLPKHW
ncbi:MAG TPA: cAMP phosphodiesterase [Porticoccaceae bacterium]|nr:cAMP phosphodiesterase [Porticoccaceae bacterium]